VRSAAHALPRLGLAGGRPDQGGRLSLRAARADSALGEPRLARAAVGVAARRGASREGVGDLRVHRLPALARQLRGRPPRLDRRRACGAALPAARCGGSGAARLDPAAARGAPRGWRGRRRLGHPRGAVVGTAAGPLARLRLRHQQGRARRHVGCDGVPGAAASAAAAEERIPKGVGEVGAVDRGPVRLRRSGSRGLTDERSAEARP